MKHDVKKFMNIVGRAYFVGTQAWLVHLYSFLIQIILQLVVLEKKYRKHNRGMNIIKIVRIVKIMKRRLKI